MNPRKFRQNKLWKRKHLAPIPSLILYFYRSSVNLVCGGNHFNFFFKNKKIETESGK
jgi:hypothetical protein